MARLRSQGTALIQHDWDDLGPLPELTDPATLQPKARGRMWLCRRCGSRIVSGEAPRTDTESPFVLSLRPQGWKPTGVRSDCGHMVARDVMES